MRRPHSEKLRDVADMPTTGTTAVSPCSIGSCEDKESNGSSSSSSSPSCITNDGSSTRASTDDGEGAIPEDQAIGREVAPLRSSNALRACFLMGVISSLAVCVGLSAFLIARWEQCAQCDRPLRWWLLIQAFLQTCQLGLRLVLLAKIRPTSRGEFMESCLGSLAVTPAWKVSKFMSVCNYGWLILGIVWLLDIEDCSHHPALPQVTALVILQSFMRILLMILYFKLVAPDTVFLNSSAPAVDTYDTGLLSTHSDGPAKPASSSTSGAGAAGSPPNDQGQKSNKID